ncbi:MAG: serine/threonine protein kinase, partial [Sandaracinaceae bacterium]|nr:serine/threonine protein kinase [Sandaracinaceae bacterium]
MALADTLATAELAFRRCGTCGEEYPGDFVVCPRDATPLGMEFESQDPLLGVVLAATYRILRPLGRGGMGRLYEAQHARLERAFAIKVLAEAHARSREVTTRFEREARALGRIRSEHVLSVVDVLRTPDGRAAIVTERLDGEDLRARLERVRTLEPREAVSIGRQVCRGLAAAHAAGVVHRDLKPSNLFLESASDGRTVVKVLDFGVAKLDGEAELTRTGTVVGTPAYMAPEQARGSSRADERADIYAVGAVLYRMLTGRAPYVGTDASAMLAAVLTEAPPRPRSLEPSIPVGLEAVVQRAMARDPADRYATALDLERELAAFDEAQGAAVERWEPPEGAVDTLVLPRGSVARAEAIARRARRARPLALSSAIAITLAAGAVAGMLAVGLQTLSSPARSDVAVAGAWLVAIAAAVASASALLRWLGRGWSSAPEVVRAGDALWRGGLGG